MSKSIVSFIVALAVTLSAPSLFAQRTIAVSGSSTVIVKPDYATFMVNVDRTVPATEKWNAAGPDSFIDALVAAGVSPQDIEVLERLPGVAPQPPLFGETETTYTPPPEPVEEPAPKSKHKKSREEDTYVPVTAPPEPPPVEPVMKSVRTSYRVKIHNLAVLPEALSIAQQTANYLPEARYDVSDRNPLKMKALSEAMENARAKAEVLAKKMGGTLDEIISIDDSESGSFFSSLIDIARLYTSGQLDGGLLNLPEMANIKVTYSVK